VPANPFTSVPGRRDAVKEALDASTAVDYFGTRHIMPVAAESDDEDGLHVVTDYAVVEIVDPDSGEVLPEGERAARSSLPMSGKRGCR